MLAGESGTTRVSFNPDWDPQLAFFGPVPSAGWSLAGVVSEKETMAPVYARLEGRVLQGVAAIAAILVIVVVMSTWIVRPVARLAEAVGRLSAGDLEARAVGITSTDEIGALAGAFNAMVQNLRENVAQLTAETTRREAVESELRVARTIQQSLLPHRFPPFPDRTEFDLHAVSAPARFVGGDFFDYFFINPHTLALVIADVSGKGVPAALLMAVTRTLIRDLAARGCSPSEALSHANRLLLDGNEEGMFVTLFLGHYDTRTGRLVYASAGHPPPYLLSPERGARLFRAATGTVLGALETQEYTQSEAGLAPGEKLVFYTDGVPEARAADGEFFRADRFERFLHEHRTDSVQALCAEAVGAVSAFQNGQQHDDLTLWCCSATVEPDPPPLPLLPRRNRKANIVAPTKNPLPDGRQPDDLTMLVLHRHR
jgi:sigma-B regulation protein RsbU (phosphoserine phosphatase)